MECREKKNKIQSDIRFFKDIIKQPCHYCGGFSSDMDENSRGNGIDRKDSNKGYETGNCVPCCKTCNFVKKHNELQRLFSIHKKGL